mmetsp:Transcript_53165/g.168813  ORF Transcript_53165/g.168813 Transcript_53165/m.168813 type:complete len:291 (+) Transcript_53165:104-976(+)
MAPARPAASSTSATYPRTDSGLVSTSSPRGAAAAATPYGLSELEVSSFASKSSPYSSSAERSESSDTSITSSSAALAAAEVDPERGEACGEVEVRAAGRWSFPPGGDLGRGMLEPGGEVGEREVGVVDFRGDFSGHDVGGCAPGGEAGETGMATGMDIARCFFLCAMSSISPTASSSISIAIASAEAPRPVGLAPDDSPAASPSAAAPAAAGATATATPMYSSSEEDPPPNSWTSSSTEMSSEALLSSTSSSAAPPGEARPPAPGEAGGVRDVTSPAAPPAPLSDSKSPE